MTNNHDCPTFHSRFGRMMHRHGLPFLWSAITGAALLGAVGYARYLHAGGVAFDPLRILYMTLQLFTLEANLDSLARVPVELTLARILCPALLAFAAWKAFAALFADEMRRLKAPFMRNHVIICGLGERGMHLTKSLRGCSAHRRSVIIIENDMENDHIPACKKMGAIVIEGNADNEAVLREARIEHADAVFAVTSDDGTNLGAALLAKKIIGQLSGNRPNPLRCRAAIGDLLFAELGHDRNLICSDAVFEFEVIRFNEISARQLFERYPLDGDGIAPQSLLRPHLVIAGFGSLGENVALQATRIGHYANGRNAVITIVDRNAVTKLNLLLQALPGLRECATWRAQDTDIQSAAFVDLVRSLADVRGEMPYVAVCINDPTLAVRAALRIKRTFSLRSLKIHVRLDSIVNAALFLKTVGRSNDETEIHPFGMLAEICSAAAIDNRQQDRLAHAIHSAYQRERAAEGKSDEATVPWETLDHDRRDSNRRQADHIPVKMRAIGCEVGPADESRRSQRVTEFTPAEVEILARVEHARWNAERFAAGWMYGEKIPGKRVSPYLVGYDDLDNSIQEYDRQIVRKIPAFLESVQQWAYRRESPVSP